MCKENSNFEEAKNFLNNSFCCFWIPFWILGIIFILICICLILNQSDNNSNIILCIITCVALISILIGGIKYLRAKLEAFRIVLEIQGEEEKNKQLKNEIQKLKEFNDCKEKTNNQMKNKIQELEKKFNSCEEKINSNQTFKQENTNQNSSKQGD